MDILINVVNQQLKVQSDLEHLVEGTQKFIKFIFALPDDWKTLQPFVQFVQDDQAYNVYLDHADYSAYLPPEIVAGKCTMMLYGSVGQVRATTNLIEFNVKPNHIIADAQSIELTESLYDQLVDMVQRFIDIADNEEMIEMIKDQIADIMQEFLDSGAMAELSIEDGSISRAKVDANFEATLVKADSAMQPSIYDPMGYGQTSTPVDPYSFAQRQDTVTIVNLKNTEPYSVTDNRVSNVTTVYTGLESALSGVLNRAELYTNAALVDYSPFTITIVEELPETGAERTFYLIPKASGNGYDKYWYIKDEDNNEVWDIFGSATTVVVDELPEDGDPDTDYILQSDSGCMYYKYIDGEWQVIAGSSAEVVEELPETGSEFVDYYLLTEDDVYVHYRWIDGEFKSIGTDTFSADEI